MVDGKLLGALAGLISGYSGVHTRPTFAATFVPQDEIVALKSVTVDAMRLLRVLLTDAFTPHDVLTLSYRLKMVRINAAADTTKMVKTRVIEDWAFGQFVGGAMRQTSAFPRPIFDAAVTVFPDAAKPDQATAIWFRDGAREKFFKRQHSLLITDSRAPTNRIIFTNRSILQKNLTG